MFSTAYSRHFGSGYVYELAVLMIGACLGPTKMVDSLVWFRSGENPAMSSAAVNRSIGMGEWGTSSEFADENEDFVSRVTNSIVDKDVASREEIEVVVREVLQQFIAYSLHKPHRPIAYWHRTLASVARKTPRWAKSLLKQNMTKTLGAVLDYKGVVFSEALEDVKQNGVAFSSEEMKETRSFLLDFHKSPGFSNR